MDRPFRQALHTSFYKVVRGAHLEDAGLVAIVAVAVLQNDGVVTDLAIRLVRQVPTHVVVYARGPEVRAGPAVIDGPGAVHDADVLGPGQEDFVLVEEAVVVVQSARENFNELLYRREERLRQVLRNAAEPGVIEMYSEPMSVGLSTTAMVSSRIREAYFSKITNLTRTRFFSRMICLTFPMSALNSFTAASDCRL